MLGGAYYLYDQRSQQVRQSQAKSAEWFGTKQQEAQRDFDKNRSKAANWVDDKAQDLSQRANKKADELTNDDRNALRRVGGKYIDTVNNAVINAHDKIVGETSRSADWVSDRKDDASDIAERTADAVRGWGESAQEFAREEIPQKANAYGGWFKSKQTVAQEKFNEAQEHYEKAKQSAKEQKKSWLSWGSSTSDEAQKQMQDAQAKLDETRKSLEAFGKDALKAAEDRYESLKKQGLNISEENKENIKGVASGFKQKYNEGKDVASGMANDKFSMGDTIYDKENKPLWKKGEKFTDSELAERTARAVAGWGETAQQLAREEYEQVLDLNGRLKNDTYDTAHETAVYTREKLSKAQEELEKSRRNWMKWASPKKEQVETDAQHRVHVAESLYDQAATNLSGWAQQDGPDAVHNARDK